MKLDKNERGEFKSNNLLLIIAALIVVVSAVAVGIYYGKMKGNNRNVASIGDTTQVGAPQDQAKAKEHFEKGVSYSLKKEYDKAIAEYVESLKYNPRVSAAHSNLGFAYFDKGDFDMAIQEQKKAIEIDSAHGNAYYGLALAYEKKGNKEEAIKNLEEFLKLSQPHSVWWNRAQEKLSTLKGGTVKGK